MSDSDQEAPHNHSCEPAKPILGDKAMEWTTETYTPPILGDKVMRWPEFLALAERLGVKPPRNDVEAIAIRIPIGKPVTIAYECGARYGSEDREARDDCRLTPRI